ncbi:hypothetical protein GCM10022398_16320 [Acetobacter lovaniensis]|uniref:hypothetical protein n=1 Tax=Acetobacter TaxID=434 RepID=UPI00140E0B67|nr:hypothetical protein [Acetobacter lovaniensis]MCI1698591.1 hypothetical protein [Acetobacter lovaniensis]MCI1795655.1 hypothetical protein [Acetobacter lovaniensis]MCP1239897.1 hypothetical protein [Acetobacter lovaniensis]
MPDVPTPDLPTGYTPSRWREPETVKTSVRIVAIDWLNPDRILSVLYRDVVRGAEATR